MIAVVAGSRKQFEQWVKCHIKYGRKDVCYIRRREDALGRRFENVFYVGTWYELDDIADIKIALRKGG